MLKVKTIYDYRAEFCAALRATPQHCQHAGLDSFDDDKHPCALGIARQLFATARTKSGNQPYDPIYRRLGFTRAQGEKIWRMNDNGYSFEQIARWVEQQR